MLFSSFNEVKSPLDYEFKNLPVNSVIEEYEKDNGVELNTIRNIFKQDVFVSPKVSVQLEKRLAVMAEMLFEMDNPIILTWGTNGDCGREGEWFDEITSKFGFVYKSVSCDCVINNVPEFVAAFNKVSFSLLASMNSVDFEQAIEDEILKKKRTIVFSNRELKRLEEVSLCCRELIEFPNQVCELQRVTSIDFNINELSKVSPCFGNLANLEYLSFHSNEFTEIPRVIFTIEKLEHIDFSRNKLTSIPKEIGNLKSLKILDFANNEILNFPSSIGHLTDLTKIELRDNEIAELPNIFESLVNLKSIVLWNNNISHLPESFFNMKSIELIFIQYGNNIPLEQMERLRKTYPNVKIK